MYRNIVQMIQRVVKSDWVKNKEQAKLRLLVKGGGCSGFEYNFSLDEQLPQANDM